MEKRYLKARETWEYLGVSRTYLYDLIKRREIPFIQLSKRNIRFDIQQIDKWMAKRDVKRPPILHEMTM